MNLTVIHHAPNGHRFAPGAFDHAVGWAYHLRQLDGSTATATAVLLAASVADDGTAVELTFSIPDPTPEATR
jgi:hypothetical protein